MAQTRRSFAQQTCIKKSGLALQRTGALWPGCRIGIAVSGGVDSFVMLKCLQIRMAILPFKMEILAIHCNPGFDAQNHAALGAWLASEGIPGHIEVTDFGPRAHSPENLRTSPCFYCAWLRRKRFFDLCSRYSLTHLAIGHNADDLAATFMLNLLRNGQVRGMEIKESFFNGSLTIIRPMLLVEKKYIRQAARQWRLPVWENTCPSNGKTARTEMENTIKMMTANLPEGRRSLLNGVMRWQLEKDTLQL